MADVTLQPRTPPPGAQPLAVAEGDLLPRFAGNWSAHLEFADQVEPPTGLVTLTWLGQQCQGKVLRSGQSVAGRTFALVAGGDGHLADPEPPELPARAYRNVQVRLVLQQLLREAGERLSAAADQAVLGQALAVWPRRQDTAAALLDDLCRELGVLWRVLLDGSVWIGRDTFAEATLAEPLQLLDEADPAYATALYIPHSFGPVPGQSHQGQRVGCAHYTICPDNAHVRLWFLASATSDLEGGNLKRGLSELIRETLPLDWYGTYPGRVVTQRPDGTLDVQFDSKLIPPIPSIPYRCFVPGARLAVPAGSRVEVRFDNADPMKPVAYLFDPGNAQKGVARLGDEVDLYYTTGVDPDGGTFVQSISAGPLAPPAVKVTLKITKASDRVFLP